MKLLKLKKMIHDRNAARNTSPVVITWPAYSPMKRQPKPQISAPISGGSVRFTLGMRGASLGALLWLLTMYVRPR